jgi:hypothetical protein
MNPYDKLRQDELQKEKENAIKRSSLEKKLLKLENQQKELRKVALTALDPAFVRRQLDKCEEEKRQITRMLSDL